ncbi:Cell wall-binding protein YocH precursor [compost metagenome]
MRRDKDTVSTIAADLKIFPLGTILYIPGYGYGVVADKGSAIRGHKIDLYFDTTKQVFKEWGKKEVEVQVVRKGDGKLTEAMLRELGKVMEVSKEIPENLWEKAI